MGSLLLAPCGAEWHGVRTGIRDCGCGWGTLCDLDPSWLDRLLALNTAGREYVQDRRRLGYSLEVSICDAETYQRHRRDQNREWWAYMRFMSA